MKINSSNPFPGAAGPTPGGAVGKTGEAAENPAPSKRGGLKRPSDSFEQAGRAGPFGAGQRQPGLPGFLQPPQASHGDDVSESESASGHPEMERLREEVDRIAEVTEYNERTLLDTTGTEADFRVGVDNTSGDRVRESFSGPARIPTTRRDGDNKADIGGDSKSDKPGSGEDSGPSEDDSKG